MNRNLLRHSLFELAYERDSPQQTNRKERQQIQQQIPTTIARRSRFNSRNRFRITLAALQSHAHAPKLLRIEMHLSAILNLSLHVLARGRIKNLRHTITNRLHAHLNAQIRRERRRRLNNHKEQRRPNVRVSPHRNHVAIDFLIYKERKRRTFVSADNFCETKKDEERKHMYDAT
jgi:hypothetical protein